MCDKRRKKERECLFYNNQNEWSGQWGDTNTLDCMKEKYCNAFLSAIIVNGLTIRYFIKPHGAVSV